MPGYDPLAIANIFVEMNGGPLQRMKQQKLVYLAHGWNLAINKEPLIKGDIEAWDGGPVLRKIWDQFKFYGHKNGYLIEPSTGKPIEVDLRLKEEVVIAHVWAKYHGYTGKVLSQMTHASGTPWSRTYAEHGQNAIIPDDMIKRHFIDLAMAGRKEAAVAG